MHFLKTKQREGIKVWTLYPDVLQICRLTNCITAGFLPLPNPATSTFAPFRIDNKHPVPQNSQNLLLVSSTYDMEVLLPTLNIQ